jgi:hypothetical protein
MAPTPTPSFHIRPAEPNDVDVILQLITDLAEYERAKDEVKATTELVGTLALNRPTVYSIVKQIWIAAS